jgi:hypothetical protein
LTSADGISNMSGIDVRKCAMAAAMAVALALAPAAAAREYLPPLGHVFVGLTAGTRIGPWERMVGKHPPVFETFMTWNTPTGWLRFRHSPTRTRLALHLSTAHGYGQPGVISPRGIALGHSDRFLVKMCRNLAHSKRIVYVRIMGEPNGYWNAYAPFNRDGSFRGPQNSSHFYIEAWRRTVTILRGGPVWWINRHLRRLGLPRLGQQIVGTANLPHPRLAFLWVPQDAGSPDIPQNGPGAFWPGSAYVDWVGTDFYSSSPNFARLSSFYDRFTGKPFVISEWAVDGADNPGFVHALFAWARAHPRVRMMNYYQGFTPSAPENLAHNPASRAALREELRSPRYLAYAPEYAPQGPLSASTAAADAPLTAPSPGAPPGPP